MKYIQLTRNYITAVDDEDFFYLRQFKWRVHVTKNVDYAIRVLKIGNKTTSIYMHREILKAPKIMEVDHINGNGLDNTRQNLRLCTHGQNQSNRNNGLYNKTGYRGVFLESRNGRYYAKLKFHQKTISLGGFETAIEAAKAYDKGAKIIFKEFATLNFKDLK